MNKLFKNKFLRENLVLVVVFALIFPPYIFADVWVADTGNEQVSRLYKEGHAPTIIKVDAVYPSIIAVNTNPTGSFYPGLKLSFGDDRKNVYEINVIAYSEFLGKWAIQFTSSSPSLVDEGVTVDSPIYMELGRAAGFAEPVSVSANQTNTNCWIADDSTNDSGITQLSGDGRVELSDTGIVEPYYTDEFEAGDTMFNLYSRDESIYPGIKIDFKSDNRAGTDTYVLETKSIDKTSYPYILETFSGLPDDHSIVYPVAGEASVLHIDRFRDKIPSSPQDVSVNSISDRNNHEYDIAWAVGGNTVTKYEKWNYRRKLSIDPTKIDDDLTNFPLCVKVTPDRITYADSNGADIRFTDAQGRPLRYEIEEWNGNDISIIWVRVSEISNTDTTIIYMYYGNTDASDNQDTENVWDSHYKMVQHLQEELPQHHIDSTSNNNDSVTGNVTQQGVADGQIDGADEFGGDDDYIGGIGEIPGVTNRLTLSLWFKVNDYLTGFRTFAGEGSPFGAPWSAAYSLSAYNPVASAHVVYAYVNDEDYSSGAPSYSLPSGQEFEWHHAAVTIDATTVRLYVDGIQRANLGWSGKNINSGRDFVIGANDDLVQNFNGIIDEVRVSDVARPAEWIKASYYSEDDDLIVFGDEQEVRYAGIPQVGGFNSPRAISVNSSDGSVWVADTGNSEVVKLYKEGHETITTVDGDYSIGDTQIILTDTSELDSGINISFANHPEDAYKIISKGEWRYRRKLVFDNSFSGNDALDNFPVMVKLTPDRITYTGSGGADIRFTDADGTELSYEIEEWNEDDTSIIWVKVPNIPAGLTSDYIWMYYGNTDASDNQDTENVWDSHYKMVQHLQEELPQHHIDSTSNNNDSVTENVTQQGVADGQIDGADEFGGDDDYVEIAQGHGLLSTDITISMWIYPTSWTHQTHTALITSRTTTSNGLMFFILSQGNLNFDWGDGSTSNRWNTGYQPPLDQWTHLVIKRDTNGRYLYVNDNLQNSTIIAGGPPTADTVLRIGADTIANRYNYQGTIDEVRISDTARPLAWIKASYYSGNDEFITYEEEELINDAIISNSITIDPALTSYVLDGSSVGRELARIYGFTNPVAVSVDSSSGNCWVADDDISATDSGDTVVWINGDISGGYNINTNSSYHRIIKGFDDPVSVAVDSREDSGDCWVACDGADSYIVKLESDVTDNYDIDNPSSSKHIRVYGFNSPQAVSVEPPDGNCWVADNTQAVKLSPDGHKYTGYVVDAEETDDNQYDVGDTIIYLTEDTTVDTYDTELYPPLKVSFGTGHYPDIKPVYEIESVNYGGSAVIELASGLTESVSDITRIYKELVRVDGFDSPSDVSAFEGEDLGELGLHPWGLQIRELYIIDDAKIAEDKWHGFPAHSPVHDATPQFRWKYLDVDGSDTKLKSYRIHLYTLNGDGFVKAWDSGELELESGVNIYPGSRIRTDWDRVENDVGGATTEENDSKSIYSSAHYDGSVFDDDDCPDLSQQSDDDSSDTGDRTYYVQLTVTNENDVSDTYPETMDVSSSDTPIITFVLDKTPPGSYRVCGTQSLLPAAEYYNIKESKTSTISSGYLQTDNYYWDEVWVEWDGGESEIVRDDSPWVPQKEVTVRVKVKDKNNENDAVPTHLGHGSSEGDEDDTDCSGISPRVRNAEYRYRSTLMAPDEWSSWLDCDEIRLFDADEADSQGEKLKESDENRNTFVWLYAKNVKFDNGDTNLIQFRVKDEGNLEVIEKIYGDTEVWIAPNMGYSHADTDVLQIEGNDVIFQAESGTYGYPIQIDTDKPEVILTEYPSNPYPHKFACFKWMGIDTTPCWFKYKLEYWDGSDWTIGSDPSAIDGEDFGSAPYNYDGPNDWLDWQTGYGTDSTSKCYTELKVGRMYKFTIKAKDQDGAVCSTEEEAARRISDEVEWVWTVAPEVPNTIITYGPSGQTEKANVNFRWRGVGGTPPYTYEYRVSGVATWQTPATRGEVPLSEIETAIGTPLEAGKTYVFEARVGDNNGVDPTPARRIFTVVNPNRPPYSPVSPERLYKYFLEMVE